MADYKPSQDTRWVDIQKRTFTRWANQYLSERMMKIIDIQKDLADGLLLIGLLEVISSKKFPSYNKTPKIRAQKLENTGLCLQFLKQEGIKLVAIGPEDITDGQLKLILGMIWTIILRYQIAAGGGASSAKNDLLQWVRKKIPECNVNNFTESWSDGRALCHLVEALEPGAFGPLDGLNPANGLDNATRGANAAEEKLSIPPVLEPADMVAAADELSCMTYISLFRDYEANEGRRRAAEIAARTADPSQCTAEGPGLVHAETGIQAPFKITLRNKAGAIITNPIKEYVPAIDIKGPSAGLQAKQKYNNDGTYDCVYVATNPGKHVIDIKIEGQPIKNSPWQVPVDRAPADATQTKVYGVGVEGPVIQGQDAPFTIEAHNRLGDRIPTGGDHFKATVKGPGDRPPQPVNIRDEGTGLYSASYKPVDYGQHVVEVTLDGKHVAKSPYHVMAKRPPGYPAALNCFADGPGLKGGDTATPAEFTIHARDENDHVVTPSPNPFVVMITDPSGDDVNSEVVDKKNGDFHVTYHPTKIGQYQIVVGLKNPVIATNWEHIRDSPFTVKITQGTSAEKSVAYGPGLETGKVQDNLPTEFTIESRDRDGNKVQRGGDPFEVKIQGPNGNVPAKLTDNGDGTYRVEYAPDSAGQHKIDITLKGKPVAKSPYYVDVKEGADHRTSSFEYFEFKVQSKTKTGKNLTHGNEPFQSTITHNGSPVSHTFKDNGDGTYTGRYKADAAGDYVVSIKVNAKDIVGSPFHHNRQ